eukprot:CAMPEP_0197465260 /NCGR_PEP_ID=MMETSP1175-20131217/64447_1 /TAXON_ID=1003142 /ORGANISM="Triceratium dubium, Strain CCMP147" /LENGTH=632 /DNA_ID=CAMNT_0043001267 /DNA_START=1094 /DNA_END=2992 /DNA_ORIENTATION=-
MGHRVSTMATDAPAATANRPPAVIVRRAIVLAVLVSAATASSSSATATRTGTWRSSTPASLAAATAPSCCFVTAERPGEAVGNGQKFRRRQRDGSEVAPAAPPPQTGNSCPYTGQLVPPSSSRLRFQSGRDVGTELAVPPVVARRKKEGEKEKKRKKRGRSWFKFVRRDNPALATVVAADVTDADDYERRKLEWAAKYTDVSTLRRSFGTNRNKLWGDFDPETTRKLYHTLLPRALIALNDLGVMTEQELAPLAYEARCAAKKYARERCVVPGRIFAMAYDGFRSWRDHGRFNPEGMTWDQVWDKYERQITEELGEEEEDDADEVTRQICLRILERSCRTNPKVDKIFLGDEDSKKTRRFSKADVIKELGEEEEDDADEVTRQICLRILERSCRTNPKVDKIFLGDEDSKKTRRFSKADVIKRKKQMDIATISAKLERDVHELLFEGAQKSVLFEEAKRERRRERREARRRRKEAKRKELEVLLNSKTQELSEPSSTPAQTSCDDIDDDESSCRRLSTKDVAVLRKIAEAKKKVIAVLRSERLVQMQIRQEMLKRLRQEEVEAKTSLDVDETEPSAEDELKIFSSDLAVPSRQSRAHGRTKVWNGRSDGTLPRRWRRGGGAVHPEEPLRGEV